MQSVSEFIEFYRPQVRQDKLIQHVCKALAIDGTFKSQFSAARKLLSSEMKSWADMVITNLMNNDQLPPDFGVDEVETARRLFEAHRSAVIKNEFGEEYFSSIEDVSLFFIYHNVIPLFVVGAIKARVDSMIQRTVTSADTAGRLPIIASLVTFLALEANQIQRVFIAYHAGSSLDILFEEDGLENVAKLHAEQKGFGKAV